MPFTIDAFALDRVSCSASARRPAASCELKTERLHHSALTGPNCVRRPETLSAQLVDCRPVNSSCTRVHARSVISRPEATHDHEGYGLRKEQSTSLV
jgi:hypothetical protein